MISVVRNRDLPEGTRDRAALDHDYFDSFTVDIAAAPAAPARVWAETTADSVAGLGGQVIWRGVLQLNLTPAKGRPRIAGWNLAEEHEDWVRLEATSWALTAHLVIEIEGSGLRVTTFIRYDRTAGRFIWQQLAPVHRRLMPGLLRGTVSARRRPGHEKGSQRAEPK